MARRNTFAELRAIAEVDDDGNGNLSRGIVAKHARLHFVPFTLQKHPHHPGVLLAVIDDQDSYPRRSLAVARLRAVHVPPPGG